MARQVVVLSGGIGGARFIRGLRHHLAATEPDAGVTAIVNTGDDVTLFGLRICPDLDTVMYTLGGGIHEAQGWGRTDESFRLKEELAAYGMRPDWFGLGDRDTATHLVRTQMMGAGYSLSQVTEALCARWQPGVRLLPATDDRVETHVVLTDDQAGEERAVHFQEWWLSMRAQVPALRFVSVGAEAAKPAPGVLDAIAAADLVVLPPSNPVVSVGTILEIPGVRDAISERPVVGVSPIVGDAPVRGMADACLSAIGVETTAEGVARLYGSRAAAGLLDGWVVDTKDAGAVGAITALGIPTRAVPAMMHDVETATALAAAVLLFADELQTVHG